MDTHTQSFILTGCFILCFITLVFSEEEGQLRLVDGTSHSNGRLEIFHNGQWGTICDDGFERLDAVVACRELGMPYANVRALSWGYYGAGTGPIHLSDVGCSGTEARLTDCIANSVDTHDCRHDEDVAVKCENDDATEEGQLRLVQGKDGYNGRVEIYHNERWGTICDDLFTRTNAKVICRQLGLPADNVQIYGRATFGPGTGPIHLDNVQCDGTETRLTDCRLRRWGRNNCYHVEDVGVGCYPDYRQEGQLRLRDGSGQSNGRVEIYIKGEWGSVCDDSFDREAAVVVCRELGLSYINVRVYKRAHYGPGTGHIFLEHVHCSGTESRLFHCQIGEWYNTACQHDEDVGVDCGEDRK